MRIFKIVLSFILFIAVAISAVIFALHYFISSDAIRLKFAQQLSAWTGYNVQLRRAPELTLYPYPRAALIGVTLTPMYNDSAPLMEAERIEVNISLWDIIFGDLSFSQTRIIHPHFIMEEPIQTIADFFATISQSNGALGLAVRDAAEQLRTNPTNFDNTKIKNQPFGRIIIENAELVYHKKDEKYAETINGINAVINWPETTKQLSFIARADWHGALSELSIEAAQPIILFAGGESQMTASFNSVRGGISFVGRSKILPDYYFNGRIGSLSPGLDQTIDWLLQHNSLNDNIATHLGKNIKVPVSLAADFSAQSHHIQFEDVNLYIGSDTVRGLLEINYQQEKPLITGSLAFSRLDLDTIATRLRPDIDNNIINLKDLNKVSLDTRISVSELNLTNIPFSNVAAALQIRNDNATIDLGNANGFGGNLQSSIEFKNIETQPEVRARISGANIDMPSLMQRFGYPTLLDGKAGITLDMQANMRDWSEITNSLQGQFVVNMVAGKINGYDLYNLPNLVMQNQELTLHNQEQIASNFNRFDIESSFSSNAFTITKANLVMGDWAVESIGKINKNNVETILSLESKLNMQQNDNKPCRTILCLQYNLQNPVKFNNLINLNPNTYIKIIRVR